MLPAISDKSYEERLSILKLPSLTYRRHRGDMILLHKVLNNHFNSDFSYYIHTPPGPALPTRQTKHLPRASKQEGPHTLKNNN